MRIFNGGRNLNVQVTVGALNVIAYADRMASSRLATLPTQSNGGGPSIQSQQTTVPSRIRDYSYASVLDPNPDIGAPQETFIYGLLTDNTGFDLLSAPRGNLPLSFPPVYTYNSFLKEPTSQTTFSFTSGVQESQIVPAPFIPSKKLDTSEDTPKLTTYNFWVLTDSSGTVDFTNVNYYNGKNPDFGDGWQYGKINQIVDSFNQAAIQIDSTNNNPVFLRRMFYLRNDALYDDLATLVSPTSLGFKPVRFNIRDGKRIINPRENIGFQITLNVDEISGASSSKAGSKGIKIKWGNIDNYASAPDNYGYIEYYELIMGDGTPPVLNFYHPIKKTLEKMPLNGPSLTTGTTRVYVHYAGNNLLIGFGEDVLNWNVIGCIQPQDPSENFTILYHLTPGGRTDSKNDSSIALEANNIKFSFKYSGVAFKNATINETNTNTYDFFDDPEADNFKKQEKQKFVVSKDFLKKISQSTRLNDFFRAKSLRLKERMRGTTEYDLKKNSQYFFASDTISEGVDRDFVSVSFARDWRLHSPFEHGYNSSNCWEIKTKILKPSYDPLLPTDFSQPENTEVSVIFDSPVYTPLFAEFNTLTMPTNDINVKQASATTQNILAASGLQTEFQFVNTELPSINGAEGAAHTPIFPFAWGDITDLVDIGSIQIRHSVDANVIGSSTMNFTMKNLIFSNRGVNILNLLENSGFVITVRAGYNENPRENEIFFQGPITNVTTARSPLGSTHTFTCKDWFNAVMENTLSLSTFSLQGQRLRDIIRMTLRLAGIELYSQFVSDTGLCLAGNPDVYTGGDNIGNRTFSRLLNFRHSNSSNKSAGSTLSSTIDTDNQLRKILLESLQFILDDNALGIIYGNNRNNEFIDSTNSNDFDCREYTGRDGVQRKVVIENRFLPDEDAGNGRVRDRFRYLVTPEHIEGNNVPPGEIDPAFARPNIEALHGMIVSELNTASKTEALYEGVYLLSVGLGNIPLYHSRNSDSYNVGGEWPGGNDSFAYLTANNILIPGTNLNVLDLINQLPVNNENTLLTRDINDHGFNWNYVGFRKRFFDDLQSAQIKIQTQQDLFTRGNLWAQYIRNIIQEISFTAIVTRPLEHYNNFFIEAFQSARAGVNQRGDIAAALAEFQRFLYKSVTYQINKEENKITAQVQGTIVPIINPESVR